MKVNPWVFFPSAALILLFLVLGAAFPTVTEVAFREIQGFIVEKLGWLYTSAVAFFLGFVVWLFFSRYGSIKLGKDDDEPDYNRLTWFAMLFSAGVGIGLLFYSIAEPIEHFARPPDAEPESVAAARDALRIAYFHWGLHAWSIYIVVGLSLAYFAFRHDLPLTIRSAFYPLLGERIYGPIGHIVDIFAVFGTLFGVATSLGLGVMQVGAGFEYLGLLESTQSNQLVLIAVITLIATTSVVSGLDVGIRRLSELNIALGLVLLGFVFIAGKTAFLTSSFVESLGTYLQDLPMMTFRTDAWTGSEWQASWTMFYWGWWISWSPFVGMFTARISKGRTIREFIGGVLIVPTLFGFFWLNVFGSTALDFEIHGATELVGAVVEERRIAESLFLTLEQLPWTNLTTGLATVVIVTYFVTSSDSGSLVIDTITSDGAPDPPVGQRIFWALAQGAVASVLLVTGGLVALQTAALSTALPFSVAIILMCWSLVRGLRSEHAKRADETH